jgi:outer membrane scaffolding protein for murein synthesis (MipA/OmpV family)
MAEEQEESTGKSLKGILIGLASTITLGVGGFITNKLTGGEEDKAPVQQTAPVINITNSNQQAQQAASGKTVIIKEKAVGGNAQPAQPQPKPKKKEGDEFKEEAPKW